MATKKQHEKPTKAELEESVNKTLGDLEETETSDELTTEEEDQEKAAEEPVEEEPVEEESEEAEPEEESEEEPEEESEEEAEPEEAEEDTDYEDKFKYSSAEAQILNSKGKKMVEAIEKASDVKEPTEEELVEEYGEEWEVMSDFEKKIAKDSMTSKKKLESISEATIEFRDMDEWKKKVDEYLSDPETLANRPELDGKEKEFAIFSLKPTRRGVDFDDLVASFLYTQGKKVKPKKKGQMFESGSAGESKKTEPKSDKLSVEEGQRLRETDYKKFLEMLKAGKIEQSVE